MEKQVKEVVEKMKMLQVAEAVAEAAYWAGARCALESVSLVLQDDSQGNLDQHVEKGYSEFLTMMRDKFDE